jgi:hypothetical protein
MQQAQSTADTNDILSQMDVILPAQYFGSLGSVRFSSEQRLMLAVLVDAINLLHGHRAGSSRKRRAFAEAAQWVNTRGTSYPFSFDSICDALEIDSAALRSRLRTVTIGIANSTRPPTVRLRLKELSRAPHLTANRLRRQNTLRAIAADGSRPVSFDQA